MKKETIKYINKVEKNVIKEQEELYTKRKELQDIIKKGCEINELIQIRQQLQYINGLSDKLETLSLFISKLKSLEEIKEDNY